MNIEILAMSAFFVIVGILLWIDRKNVQFSFGIIIRRWKRGLEFIDTLIKKYPKAIKITGYTAVVIGFLVCIGGFLGLFVSDILGIKLFGMVLPTAGGYEYPGPIVGVPFWYWIIAIFIILFVHETMHGVFSRAAKVPIKNYGIMLLLLLPIGAFVEPDMKKVKKLKIREKLQIFAAGSFANFVTAFVCFLLVLLFSLLILIPTVKPYIIEPYGVFVNETMVGYPAHDVNLTGFITSANGIQIKTSEDLSNVLNNTNVGDEITIITTDSNYTMKTVPRPDNQTESFIGISSGKTFYTYSGWSATLLNLFGWLIALNVGIGIANLLPWKPFDGGLMIEEVFVKTFKKKGKIITKILTFIVLALILYNLFGIKQL